jgi:hypothetical protein
MFVLLPVSLHKVVPFLCCAALLGLTTSASADPKPLSKEEQAKVDKAIDKGVAYLKRIQREKGNWPLFVRSGFALGQTLLPAYALLESGVPADDPVIKKAADFIRPRVLKLDQTYDVSLAILFLDRLGDPQDKKSIQSLALRLIASQHRTGGWSYRCLTLSEANETALLKSLEKLSKHLKEGGTMNREALQTLEVPHSLRVLTIFQDPKKNAWAEQGAKNDKEPQLLLHTTDNSNTQFAMLGLWAAQRRGVPMEATFRIMVERFERSQVANGWWTYTLDHKGDPAYIKEFPSMICVGLLGLGIGRGLKLPSPGSSRPLEADLRILKGFAALSQDLDVAAGRPEDPLTKRGSYYLWSVERVAMLYDLPMIGDKDWYKWGGRNPHRRPRIRRRVEQCLSQREEFWRRKGDQHNGGGRYLVRTAIPQTLSST